MLQDLLRNEARRPRGNGATRSRRRCCSLLQIPDNLGLTSPAYSGEYEGGILRMGILAMAFVLAVASIGIL